MPFTTSAVSAPGKVLLAGGYLVLDRDYSGLVFALSARIHAVSAQHDSSNSIIVRSPQFVGAQWEFNISPPTSGSTSRGMVVTPVPGTSKNPFVETTIRYVLSYLSSTNPSFTSVPLPGATITIYADNDYYSQPPSPTPHPRFNNLNVPIDRAHKTGLGSSAALTTALTACLLSTYSPEATALDFSTSERQQAVHNLAQACHCAAQGKVGSGFDVAAAVFGSCVYRRFSPSLLDSIGDASSEGFAKRLQQAVDKPWDLSVEKTKVPPGLRLVMGDVDCGSSTPGMVRKVLAWRKENPQAAKQQWDTIEELNKGLIKLLANAERLSQDSPQGYAQALRSINEPSAKGTNVETLLAISGQLGKIRRHIREMGKAAGVAIEPPAQTMLLDSATSATEGVLGGVVPGAGGYDAVVFLTTEDTVKSLSSFLERYAFGGAGEGEGKVRALGAREEHEGVRKENVPDYGV